MAWLRAKAKAKAKMERGLKTGGERLETIIWWNLAQCVGFFGKITKWTLKLPIQIPKFGKKLRYSFKCGSFQVVFLTRFLFPALKKSNQSSDSAKFMKSPVTVPLFRKSGAWTQRRISSCGQPLGKEGSSRFSPVENNRGGKKNDEDSWHRKGAGI